MNPFQYVTASSPDEAVSLIGKNGRYLAGGTDLLGEMKDYIVSPDTIVALRDFQGVDNMGLGPGGDTSIDSQMTIAKLAQDPRIQAQFPGLAEAANEVGSPQIRNVATLGGNLLQHSRCWYYRQPDIVCLKRGGDMCHAQEGENKYHSRSEEHTSE